MHFISKTFEKVLNTEGSHLIRISLMRFFKTFQQNLAYAFLSQFISLLQFFGYFGLGQRTALMK